MLGLFSRALVTALAAAAIAGLVACSGDDSSGGGSGSGSGSKVIDPDRPTVIDVRRVSGGTARLPLGDLSTMQQLQGIGTSPAPTVVINTPRDGEVIRTREIPVAIDVRDFLVGRDVEGRPDQFARVTLDAGASVAQVFDPTRHATIRVQRDGWHVITAELCREHGLALKNPQASHQIAVYVDTGVVPPPNLDGAVVIYGEPRGSYSKRAGEAAAILIDFQVRNVTLAPDGYRVRATLDEGFKTYLFETGLPKVIQADLPLGTHTLKLELIDEQGLPVDCPFNPTTGTFEVIE